MLFKWHIELHGFLLLIFAISFGLTFAIVFSLMIVLWGLSHRESSAVIQAGVTSRDTHFLLSGSIASLSYAYLFSRGGRVISCTFFLGCGAISFPGLCSKGTLLAGL